MKYLIVITVFFTHSISSAASCCGGGFSIPSLILGDDKSQVTSTLSFAQISDDVLDSKKWLKRSDENQTQTLKLDAATLISDRWQTGMSIPLITKNAKNAPPSSGIGDISLYLGHETFAETSYSRWRPKGVSYLQITLPTSPSIYDSGSITSTDIRGRGFYSLGAGVALLKSWKIWDINFNTEIHRAFSRRFNNTMYDGEVEVQPGWGLSQTWGLGWNRGNARLGTGLTFLYEDPIRTSGATNSNSSMQKNITFNFQGSYMFNSESAITLSYADQTLLGEPINSSLSKTLTLSYQQRWPR